MADERAAELRRIAPAPDLVRERVAELDLGAGPAQRVQAAVANHGARVEPLDREEGVAAADQHVAVGAQGGGGLAHRAVRPVADVAHHRGVGVDLVHPRLVGAGERPQAQALRRQLHARSAARTAASSAPSTRTSLSRAVCPRTTCTREGGTPAASATSAHSAAFAFPSTGGAVTRTTMAPARSPTTSLRRARGCSRMGMSACTAAIVA